MDGDVLYSTEMLERLIASRHGTVLLIDRDYSTVAGFALSVLKHLPATGETFAGNGFRMSANEPPGDTVNTGDDELWLPKQVPLAIRLDAYIQAYTGGRAATDFETRIEAYVRFHLAILGAAGNAGGKGRRRGRPGLLPDLGQLLDRAPGDVRLVVLHLGSGCSAAAVRHGVSVDTSMGFTPLEGLVMSTRSGDLDPALLGYLARAEGVEVTDVEEWLNARSGLLGLAGGSGDVRDLLARERDDPGARVALEVFCHRARKYLGAYLAVLALALDRQALVDEVLEPNGHDKIWADVIAGWGKASVDWYANHSNPADKVVVVGSPRHRQPLCRNGDGCR